MVILIDGQAPDTDLISHVFMDIAVRVKLGIPPELGLYPRGNLQGVKRLCHIIICSRAKS